MFAKKHCHQNIPEPNGPLYLRCYISTRYQRHHKCLSFKTQYKSNAGIEEKAKCDYRWRDKSSGEMSVVMTAKR
jgi:hypothetical protein